ncbi:hypothetical protein UFOVP431_77 [uncultured Caudovirales phage]|uniref:Uncharacterized protein n=1 Tax=uncultured Caudovirales phage TaxID=2100421 RepID=A0A6J5MQJ5_9CAUD|nr:hypothetical protein UFOVP431_77 [uncultured Caudovirales phage]
MAAGWALSKADRWFVGIRKADDATALALVKLNGTVSHLDGTIARLDSSLDRLWAKYNDHEHRITVLETRND